MEAAVELGVPMAVLGQALSTRFLSRQDEPYAGRLMAALRREFGGHRVFAPEEGKQRSGTGVGAIPNRSGISPVDNG